jgi:hypothetical protein
MITLLLALAFAEDPVAAEPEPEVIVVYGGAAIREARAVVARKLDQIGWRNVREVPDGSTVFAGPERWMGTLWLTPDGLITFKLPFINTASPGSPQNTYTTEQAWDANATATSPGYVGATFTRPSKKKLQGVRDRTLDQVMPELMAYRQVVAVTTFERDVVQPLPRRLDALWTTGAAIEGSATYATTAERRAVLLDYWVTRTDTPEGELVRRTVEDFLREVVGRSPDPVTGAERAAAEARAGRELSID